MGLILGYNEVGLMILGLLVGLMIVGHNEAGLMVWRRNVAFMIG